MKKMLLVQPHSDDILFSCSHYLFNPDEYQVQVLTVENDPKRIEEDKKLYDFLGIKYNHLNVDFKDDSYYSFHKEYKEVTPETTTAHLMGYFGEEKMTEISSAIFDFVSKFAEKNPDYSMVLPWGIGHPFHLFVRDTFKTSAFACCPNKNLYFYREFPHSYKRRSQPQVEYQQKWQYLLLNSFPTEEIADVKWKLASKFYKTQSGLLFYEQGYIKKNLPEEIYELNDLPF